MNNLADLLTHGLEPLRRFAQLSQALTHVRQRSGLAQRAIRERLRHLLLRGRESLDPLTQLHELLLDQGDLSVPHGPSHEHRREQGDHDGDAEQDACQQDGGHLTSA